MLSEGPNKLMVLDGHGVMIIPSTAAGSSQESNPPDVWSPPEPPPAHNQALVTLAPRFKQEAQSQDTKGLLKR